jgi:hypothetical protein
VIIAPNAGRDYVVAYSRQMSRIRGESIISFYLRIPSDLIILISNYRSVNLRVRKNRKLLRILAIFSTVAPGLLIRAPSVSLFLCCSAQSPMLVQV